MPGIFWTWRFYRWPGAQFFFHMATVLLPFLLRPNCCVLNPSPQKTTPSFECSKEWLSKMTFASQELLVPILLPMANGTLAANRSVLPRGDGTFLSNQDRANKREDGWYPQFCHTQPGCGSFYDSSKTAEVNTDPQFCSSLEILPPKNGVSRHLNFPASKKIQAENNENSWHVRSLRVPWRSPFFKSWIIPDVTWVKSWEV